MPNSFYSNSLSSNFIECEKLRRRRTRIIQVRNQTNEFSKRVRLRVKQEHDDQINRIAKEEYQKFIQRKKNELAVLEQEYQKALSDIGLGHKGIKEHEEYQSWKIRRLKRDREIALCRGNQTLNEIHNQKVTENKIKENKNNLRKCIAMTERLRAAEVRAGKENLKNVNKIRVVEIDAKDNSKKVRFLDKGKIVPSGKHETESVRRIPLSDISTNGVEAAIIEQENEERKSWQAEKREIEMARVRGMASLRKLRDEKENHPSFSYGADSITDYTRVGPVRRITDEGSKDKTIEDERIPRVLRSRTSGVPEQTPQIPVDLDQIPVRGPLTETPVPTQISDKQSPSGSSDQSGTPILDAVISRYPTDDIGRPLMGGPASAFKDPKIRESCIPELQDGIEITQGTPAQDSPKTNEGDRNFISKVLKDFELPYEHGLKVKVDVQEMSTINSSLSITQERERTTQGETTRTTIKSSTTASMSSSSSIDITKEKFLSEQWKQRQMKEQGFAVPEYEQLHSLIGKLESKERRNAKEVQRQNQLRNYIERLLQMKRKEIDDLSITDVSSLTTSFSSFKESSCSQAYSSSAQSTPSYSKRNLESSIQMGSTIVEGFSRNSKTKYRSRDVVSSTPNSILSSADSKSSANKTVRFAVQGKQDIVVEETNNINNWLSEQRKNLGATDRRGSYEISTKNSSLSSDEVEKQRNDIINKTRLSLTQIRNYYEDQRKKIELELQTRKLRSDKKKEESHEQQKTRNGCEPCLNELSEGPLTTETESSHISEVAVDRNSPSIGSNSSQKESSMSSNNNSLNNERKNKQSKTQFENKRLADKHLALDNLNKTSSSGTATSSSNATAELLSRIRQIKIPALAHPPPNFWNNQANYLRRVNENQMQSTDVQSSSNADHTKGIKKATAVDPQLLSEVLKDHEKIAELELKRAGQNIGMESETFSSFHFTDEGSLDQLSEQYSSISISSEDNA